MTGALWVEPFTSSSAQNVSIDTLCRVTWSLLDGSKCRLVTHALFLTSEGWQILINVSREAHVHCLWTPSGYRMTVSRLTIGCWLWKPILLFSLSVFNLVSTAPAQKQVSVPFYVYYIVAFYKMGKNRKDLHCGTRTEISYRHGGGPFQFKLWTFWHYFLFIL